MPISTSLIGASGEHYVLFRLLSMGYIAGLAPDGAPNADIIMTNVETKKSIAIQVKTRLQRGNDNGWHMKAKHEDIQEDNLFYCFVDIPDDLNSVPNIYIIPSKIVAKALYEVHRVWLAIPGRNGRMHKDTEMRRLLPDYSRTIRVEDPIIKKYSNGWIEKYKENWDILNLEK